MVFVDSFDAAEAAPTEFGQKRSLTNPTTLSLSSSEPDADTFCFLQQQCEAFGDPTNLPNENYNQQEIFLANLSCLLENQHFWGLNYLACVCAFLTF